MSDNTPVGSAERGWILNQFRNAVNDILKPEHDDAYLLRWLKARDFDIPRAEKMIRKSFKLMHNIGAEDVLKSDFKLPRVVEEYLPMSFWGFDKEGSPIRSNLMGKTDWIGLCRSLTTTDIIRSLTYYMELDMKKCRIHAKKVNQMIYIMDFSHLSLRLLMNKIILNRAILFIMTYQDNFPELLKAAYLIKAPSYLQIFLNIVKPFINENTWKKIKIFSGDEHEKEILQLIDPEFVPQCYGGKMHDPKYHPNYVANNGIIPMSYYVKEDSYLKFEDPTVIKVVIPERNSFHHAVNVLIPGTVIKWIFQTKDYNVKFGVIFKFSQDSYSEELVKEQLVESYPVPERGQLLCKKVGIYVLYFDNNYSWVVKKRLLLKVEVEEPSK